MNLSAVPLIIIHLSMWPIFQTEQEHEIKLQEQREKQQELISQLKSQLEDMEKYAYEVLCRSH